jgi:hypothetical protein
MEKAMTTFLTTDEGAVNAAHVVTIHADPENEKRSILTVTWGTREIKSPMSVQQIMIAVRG